MRSKLRPFETYLSQAGEENWGEALFFCFLLPVSRWNPSVAGPTANDVLLDSPFADGASWNPEWLSNTWRCLAWHLWKTLWKRAGWVDAGRTIFLVQGWHSGNEPGAGFRNVQSMWVDHGGPKLCTDFACSRLCTKDARVVHMVRKPSELIVTLGLQLVHARWPVVVSRTRWHGMLNVRFAWYYFISPESLDVFRTVSMCGAGWNIWQDMTSSFEIDQGPATYITCVQRSHGTNCAIRQTATTVIMAHGGRREVWDDLGLTGKAWYTVR